MKKATKIKWALGIGMVGLLAFTVSYVMKQIRLLVNTEFNMVGTQVNKMSLREINLTLWWKVVNKSDISITLDKQKYDVFLNGKFLKQVGSGTPIEVAPHADTRIPTYVVFSPIDALKVGVTNFGALLTKEGRKKLNIEVKGTMDIKTSVFTVDKYPFEFEDSLQNIMEYE